MWAIWILKKNNRNTRLENETRSVFVEVIIRLWVQFRINLHEWVFQKVSKFYEPAGRVKFELFEKLTSAN